MLSGKGICSSWVLNSMPEERKEKESTGGQLFSILSASVKCTVKTAWNWPYLSYCYTYLKSALISNSKVCVGPGHLMGMVELCMLTGGCWLPVKKIRMQWCSMVLPGEGAPRIITTHINTLLIAKRGIRGHEGGVSSWSCHAQCQWILCLRFIETICCLTVNFLSKYIE